MPNITIYLSDELAEAVKAAQVSVSPICQEALKREVERMQATAIAEDDVKAAARRLLDARDEEQQAEIQRGMEAGRSWALERAMPSELDEVSRIAAQWWEAFGYRDDQLVDLWPTLYEELATNGTYARDPDDRYLIRRSDFMVGFVDGAAEAYNKMLEIEPSLRD